MKHPTSFYGLRRQLLQFIPQAKTIPKHPGEMAASPARHPCTRQVLGPSTEPITPYPTNRLRLEPPGISGSTHGRRKLITCSESTRHHAHEVASMVNNEAFHTMPRHSTPNARYMKLTNKPSRPQRTRVVNICAHPRQQQGKRNFFRPSSHRTHMYLL